MSFNGIILEGGHSKPWVISVNAEGEPKPFVVKLYRTIDIDIRNKMAAETVLSNPQKFGNILRESIE